MTRPELEPGQVVERYTVEERVGTGGMAQVYRVRHNALGSVHALKVLQVEGEAMHQRMVQEGQLQAQLRHPNIVAVTDVVSVDGGPALVMDYVEGPTLAEWLDQNQPDLAQAEAIFRGILAGVARAHRVGMVHRDLKPANVLMATDEDGVLVPKVADFGLAKIVSGETGGGDLSNTRTGTTMGTPAYMAPEQVRDSKSVDQRADIFALGCILYELFTGASPFYHPDLFQIFNALASGSYTPAEVVVPDLPQRIRNAIEGSLATKREARIHSCNVLLAVLDGRVSEDWASIPRTEEVPIGGQAPELAGPDAAPTRRSWAPVSSPPEPTFTESAIAPARPLRLVGGLTVAAIAAVGLGTLGVVAAIGVAAAVWWGLSPSSGPDAELAEVTAPVEVGGEAGDEAAIEAGGPPEGAAGPGSTGPGSTGTAGTEAGSPGSPGSAGGAGGATGSAGEPEPAGSTRSPASTGSTGGQSPPPDPATTSGGPSRSGPASGSGTRSGTGSGTGTGSAAGSGTGTVAATGDADEVWLEGPAGRVELGSVAAGTYRVMAGFDGEAPIPAGRVTLKAGQTVTLGCSAAFQLCQVR